MLALAKVIEEEENLRIAHISDCHLDTSTLRSRRLERIIAEVAGLDDVAALVVSGDIADHGKSAEYDQFFRKLPRDVPVVVVPGNHDVRSAMLAHLPGEVGGYLNSAFTVADLTIIGLDSLVEEEVGGFLAEETLTFAHETIEAVGGRVILTLHHPPVPVGHDLMDRLGLRNPGDLRDLLDAHDEIVGVLTGHVHTALATTFAGKPLIGAPGIVSTMRLGNHTDPIADPTASPGLAVHTLDGTVLRSVFHFVSPGDF